MLCTAMLTISQLRKSFGATCAVDGVSLAVRAGEVFGLLGPNGAGKTTTIGMATGLIRPDAGTVTLEGAGSPTTPAARRRLGVAPQALAIYDELTGEENLKFFGRLYGMGGAGLVKRVNEALELVGLGPRRYDRAGVYSGGMKRRLNLAAALVHEPALLLLDEPTAGVDPQSRNNILDLVRTLAAHGTTILYTTHYMEEASRLCDRVAIMDQGRVLALGTVEELIRAHGGASTVTIERGAERERIATADPLREIAAVLARADTNDSGNVSGVRIDRPDLESVFLNLTGRSLRD